MRIRTAPHPLVVVAATGLLAAAVPGALAAGRHHRPVVRRVNVTDNMFTPEKLTIHVGNAVNFVWSDTNFNTHNVTLVSAPKGVSRRAFTSVDGTRRLHFEKRFTVPGAYLFTCTIHPEMHTTVIVRR